MALQVEQLPLGAFQSNCYVVRRPNGAEALVVDPGWPGEASRILAALEAFGFPVPELSPEAIADRRRMLQMGVPPVQIHVMSAISGVE